MVFMFHITHSLRKHALLLGHFMFKNNSLPTHPIFRHDLRHDFALPPEVILWCLMLAQPLNNTGPSRLWVPLVGIVFHLKSALFHRICPARFTSSLKLLFSPGPWLGAPLSSYLEGALYKFHR